MSARRATTALCVLAFVLFMLSASPLSGQVEDKPIPILTGNFGAFSFVSGGQNVIDTQINPVLLVPLGNRWLIESRAEFEGEFQRPSGGGPYAGPVDKHVDYAQVDYIASPYLTITAGRSDAIRNFQRALVSGLDSLPAARSADPSHPHGAQRWRNVPRRLSARR